MVGGELLLTDNNVQINVTANSHSEIDHQCNIRYTANYPIDVWYTMDNAFYTSVVVKLDIYHLMMQCCSNQTF